MAQGMFGASTLFGPSEDDVRAEMNAGYDAQRSKAGEDNWAVYSANMKPGFDLLSEAMGGGDPRIKQAKKLDEIKKYAMENAKGNTTLDYYRSLAAAFRKFGMFEQALNIDKTIEQLEDKDEDRSLNKEKAQWARDDRRAALAAKGANIKGSDQFAAALKAITSADPESEAAAWTHFISTGGDMKGALALIKSKDGRWGPVYEKVLDGKRMFFQDNLQTNESKNLSGGGVSIDQRTENAMVGADVASYSEQQKEFNKLRAMNLNAVPAIQEMENLVKRGVYQQGLLPDLKKIGVRTLVQAGLASEKDLESLKDSEIFDRYVMEFVLPKMKMLGGSDSNEELRAIRDSTANRGWTKEAVQQFVDAAKREVALVERKKKEHDKWKKNSMDYRSKNIFDFQITPEERAAYDRETGYAPAVGKDQPNAVVVPKAAIDKYIQDAASRGRRVSPEQAEAFLRKLKEQHLSGRR